MFRTVALILFWVSCGSAVSAEPEALRNAQDPKELWIKVDGAVGCSSPKDGLESVASEILKSNGINPLTGSTSWPFGMHLRIEVDCIPVVVGMDSDGNPLGAIAYAVSVSFAKLSGDDYAQFPWNTSWVSRPDYQSIGKTDFANPKPLENAIARLTEQAIKDYRKANFQ